MAALGDGAGVTLNELLEAAGGTPHGARHWADAMRGRGNHTTAIMITLAVERLHDHMPAGRTRRALAAVHALREEVAGILGDDAVLLHHPHPRVAPKHGATVGRAWVITPSAVFNLLGLPVTQVPLGLNGRGLPLGSRSPPPPGGTTSRSRPRWSWSGGSGGG